MWGAGEGGEANCIAIMEARICGQERHRRVKSTIDESRQQNWYCILPSASCALLAQGEPPSI
jgi:hypothetical protein